MNFAEEMAFWYLRLNGFFPLERFVFHRVFRERDQRRYNADGDLLAIRPPHVTEQIGGQENDWDLPFFNEILRVTDLNPFLHNIAVIGEVKAGIDDNEPGEAFAVERLVDAVLRLGLVPAPRGREVARELLNRSQMPLPEAQSIIVKVLFTDVAAQERRFVDNWYQFPLRCVDTFILERMRRYHPEKEAARHFFDSDLIQYYIWKARQ